MPIIKLPINIEKSGVLRYLGYKNPESEKIYPMVEEQVDMAIREAYKMAEPQINYGVFKVTVKTKDKKILLENGHCFSGSYIFNKLKEAEEAVIAILTIGSKIEEKSGVCFSQGDYLQGMIYDAIGSVALKDLKKSFFKKLCEKARIAEKGITCGLSPGDGDWSIQDQTVIFKLVYGEPIGVSLKDSMMMTPVKSISVVYGMGKGLAIPDEEHDCTNCNLINCQFRAAPRQYDLIVCFDNQEYKIKVPRGESLYKVLVKHGFPVNGDCGGYHICGKCKVIVNSCGEMPISEAEKKLLTEEELNLGVRLACFIKVNEDITVSIPDSTKKAAVLTDHEKEKKIGEYLNPHIERINVKLAKPSLDDQRDDLTRLIEGLDLVKSTYMPASLLKTLPVLLEQFDYGISCTLRKNEIIDLREYNTKSGLYGMAVDIGTTTIAAYLFDLQSGENLDIYSSLNPQRVFGSDVISRINHTITQKDGLAELQGLLIKELNHIIDFFCERNNISSLDLYEIVVVGNTVIMHLLLGVPCKNIANAPYIPAFTSKMEIKAAELGLNINPEGYIVTLPLVSGYIGADTVAAVLASGMAEDDEINLLLDIGTNGEIVLGNSEELLSCSTAAGPAFEGVGITFGIGGVDGAIDHVDLKKTPIYTTIGGSSPKGICGSGIIDTVAELLKYKIIDNTGMFCEEYGKKYFILDEKSKIYVTQQDIRQIQLAKAAISAGVKVLIKHMQIELDKIKRVYLAGGFGNYINIESAAIIGLIPAELKNRVKLIGNGAGTGAIMCLLSEEMIKKACLIKERIKYLELSSLSAFSEEFMDSMYF